MQNNKVESELYFVSPALSLLYAEIKEIVSHQKLSGERRNKARDFLNSIRENILLIASDSEREHDKEKCHCIVALDLIQELADFLRAKESSN